MDVLAGGWEICMPVRRFLVQLMVLHILLCLLMVVSAMVDGSGGCFCTGMLVTFVSAFPIVVELRQSFLSLFPPVHLDSSKSEHF